MSTNKRNLGHGASLEVDWLGGLPEVRMQAFETYTKELERPYLMFSVSLNEAISLHQSGLLAKSFEVIVLTSELCAGFATSLENTLRSLDEYRRERGTNPTVGPLNPSHFRDDWSRLLALKSLMWHRLLARKSRFPSKIRSLRSLVSHARRRFSTVAEEFAIDGILADSPEAWTVMDSAHFDLNTCLRESFVVLKCFLRVLPDEDFPEFQESVSKSTSSLLGPRRVNAKAAGR